MTRKRSATTALAMSPALIALVVTLGAFGVPSLAQASGNDFILRHIETDQCAMPMQLRDGIEEGAFMVLKSRGDGCDGSNPNALLQSLQNSAIRHKASGKCLRKFYWWRRHYMALPPLAFYHGCDTIDENMAFDIDRKAGIVRHHASYHCLQPNADGKVKSYGNTVVELGEACDQKWRLEPVASE